MTVLQPVEPSQERRKPGTRISVPELYSSVSPDPQAPIIGREQCIDTCVGQLLRSIDEASVVEAKESDISRANPDLSVTRLGERDSNTVYITRISDGFELPFAVSDCATLQSPEQRMTFTVKRHRSECGLLQAITDSCILEFPVAIA